MSRIFNVSIKGETFEVIVDEITPNAARKTAPFAKPAPSVKCTASAPVRKAPTPRGKEESNGIVAAVMPGVILAVMVAEGQEVAEGQPLMVLEAMKMENPITAPKAGKVTSLKVANGDKVNDGDVLCVIA